MTATPQPLARTASYPHTPEELLHQRYGAEKAAPPHWNAALEAILSHRSVRAYLPEPVSDATLELIVAAAQSAPTSSNLQAWSVVAVTERERKARLAEIAGPNPQILSAPLFLVWIADLSRLRGVAARAGNEGEALDYLESFLLAGIDAALAAQNAVVSIDSLGLGSCYIGGIRNRPEEVAETLGLPPETVAVFGLTVGRPDPSVETAIKPRLPQAAVLHRETWRTASPEPDIDAYDEALRRFQTGQSLPAVGWKAAVARRVENALSLKGRDRLAEYLKKFGFKLK